MASIGGSVVRGGSRLNGGFFAGLTKHRLKRGVFHSLVDLQAAINRFLAEHDESPKPVVRSADPDKIIATVRRGRQVLASIHQGEGLPLTRL